MSLRTQHDLAELRRERAAHLGTGARLAAVIRAGFAYFNGAPTDAGAHARLFSTCAAASQPQALHELVLQENQLGAWWSTMEAARCLVHTKLRSPYGGPAQTFEGLDRMLTATMQSKR